VITIEYFWEFYDFCSFFVPVLPENISPLTIIKYPEYNELGVSFIVTTMWNKP